jgi:hypothetical protein
MQAAAMGRVHRLHVLSLALQLARREPRIGAPLGAVAVQDIEVEFGGKPRDLAEGAPVSEADIALHGNPRDAERAIVDEAAHLGADLIAAALRVADDAYFAAELRLAHGQIVHMAEQAADRRAQTMQDAKRGAHWTPRSDLRERQAGVSFRRSVRGRK